MSELTRRAVIAGAGSLAVTGCAATAKDADYCLADGSVGAQINDDGPFPDPGDCQVTAEQIEGPFYTAGAPSEADMVEDDGTVIVTLSGVVFEAGCATPLAGALVEVWHADETGGYDDEGFRYRTALTTDADGAWSVRTVRPGAYLNGNVYRPRHYHLKVTVDGVERLTTQLYFDGDEYLECDPFANTSLVVPFAGNETDGFDGAVALVLA